MLAQQIPLEKFFNDDLRFNQLYPKNIQAKAARHWTPLEVAKTAADFLAPHNDVHVLDIGSGIGKFCLAAAYHKPNNWVKCQCRD